MASEMVAAQGADTAKEISQSQSPSSSAQGGASGDINKTGGTTFGTINIAGSKSIGRDDNSVLILGASIFLFYYFTKK